MENNNTEPNNNDNTQTEPTVNWQERFEGQQKVNRDLESKLKEARKALDGMDALKAQVAELQGKTAEYEAAKKEQAVRDEALRTANTRIIKAEVRAAATGRLRDPSDAFRYLDLSDLSVSDDGETDNTAISAKITSLLEAKPYLAAQKQSGVITPPPSGSRDGDANAGQLTREALRRMSPQEIVKAQKEGRLDGLLGKTNH